MSQINPNEEERKRMADDAVKRIASRQPNPLVEPDDFTKAEAEMQKIMLEVCQDMRPIIDAAKEQGTAHTAQGRHVLLVAATNKLAHRLIHVDRITVTYFCALLHAQVMVNGEI